MFNKIWNWIVDLVNNIISAVMFVLPDSPFVNFTVPEEVQKILGYVNYFVPIGAMLGIAAAWLTAIGAYYLWQTILRWAKAIK